jgi:O-antigen/teichoic acid export membrane protein
VQHRRGADPAFLKTVWTLQLLRGFGLGLLSLVVAPLVAAVYSDERLLWVLPAIGLTGVIAGFNSTRLLTVVREMALGRPTLLELAAQAGAALLAISWAWISPGVWALIAGSLASALIRLVLSFRLPGQIHHRLSWNPGLMREAVPFAGWIWLSTLVTFLASQTDRLILGKLFTLDLLAVYGIALVLSELPRNVVSVLSTNVLYPMLTRVAQQNPAQLRRALLRTRWGLLLVMAVGLVVLAGFGDMLVQRLYDHRYAAAAWMLPLLAIGVWPSILAYTLDPSLLALGVPRYAVYGHIGRALFTAVGLPIGFLLAGPLGAVLVVALNDLPFYAQILRGISRHGLKSPTQDLLATLAFASLLAAVLVWRSSVGLRLPFALPGVFG